MEQNKEFTRSDMEDFGEWMYKLRATERCTVHPPAGSGAGYGIYLLTTSQLLDKYLNERGVKAD